MLLCRARWLYMLQGSERGLEGVDHGLGKHHREVPGQLLPLCSSHDLTTVCI